MKDIYLDHNATTPLLPEVLDAMRPYLTDKFGNASSVHAYGREARVALNEARERVAYLIGAKSPDEIVFTSGGTESDNLATQGTALAAAGQDIHVLTSAIEHAAVMEACRALQRAGRSVTFVGVDRLGLVDVTDIERRIQRDTCLISVMCANNEMGALQPIERIAEIAQEHGIPLHTDAVQAAGRIPINVDKWGVSMASLSGHKIYGPKGVGALYIRQGTKLHKLLHGGGQEGNRRAGTENVPGIVGFGKAAEIACRDMVSESRRMREVIAGIRSQIQAKLDGVWINTPESAEKSLPGTVNVSFEAVDGQALVLQLASRGICVSTGSACHSGSREPSHVLSAMGVDAKLALGSVRLSAGRLTLAEDIDYIARCIVDAVTVLRATN